MCRLLNRGKCNQNPRASLKQANALFPPGSASGCESKKRHKKCKKTQNPKGNIYYITAALDS